VCRLRVSIGILTAITRQRKIQEKLPHDTVMWRERERERERERDPLKHTLTKRLIANDLGCKKKRAQSSNQSFEAGISLLIGKLLIDWIIGVFLSRLAVLQYLKVETCVRGITTANTTLPHQYSI
jgi:hypothetical protein